MDERFGISQALIYLQQMGIHTSQIHQEQEIIELAFHGTHEQWRMIIAFQQQGEVRKLLLIAPHIGIITNDKRTECLEALMAINYRIAMGKFGMDLDDGEVRLEEALPLGNGSISFEQFQLAFGAIMQTVATYHSLIPRIIYGNLSAQAALEACEQAFFQEYSSTADPTSVTPHTPAKEQPDEQHTPETQSSGDLNVHEILAEVTRMFEDEKD